MVAVLLSRRFRTPRPRSYSCTLGLNVPTMSESVKRQADGAYQIQTKRVRGNVAAHDGDGDGDSGPSSMDVVAPTNRFHIVRLFDLASTDAMLCLQRGLSLVIRAGNRGLLHERLMKSLQGVENEFKGIELKTNTVLRELLRLREHEAGAHDGGGGSRDASVVPFLIAHPTMQPYLMSDDNALIKQRNAEYACVGTFAGEVEAASEFYETARRVFRWLQEARNDICGLYGGGSEDMEAAVDNLLRTMQRLVHTVGHATLALVHFQNMTRPF